MEKPPVGVAPSSHWSWVVGADESVNRYDFYSNWLYHLRVRMQPRPLPSVIAPVSIQNSAGDRLLSPIRFCPSLSCPTEPDAPPEALKWKQQLSPRVMRAWEPAAKAAMLKKVLILVKSSSENDSIRMISRPNNNERFRMLEVITTICYGGFGSNFILERRRERAINSTREGPVDSGQPGSDADPMVDVIRFLGSHGMVEDLLLLSPKCN